MTDKERPKQFAIDEKWDKVIDLSLRRVVYGTLAGGLAGLVLFREAPLALAVLTDPLHVPLYLQPIACSTRGTRVPKEHPHGHRALSPSSMPLLVWKTLRYADTLHCS